MYFQVDKLYKESCDAGGDYCQFHRSMMAQLRGLAQEDWFTVYGGQLDSGNTASSGGEYVWNEDTQSYEMVFSSGTILKMNQLTDVFKEVLNGMDLFSTLEPETSSPDLFLTDLEAFEIWLSRIWLFRDLISSPWRFTMFFS